MSSEQRVNPDTRESTWDEPAHAEIAPKPLGGRRGFKVVAVAATLVVLSAAGYSIAQSLREADWLLALGPQAGGGAADQAKAQAAPAPAPAVEDPADRSELHVFTYQPGGETIVLLTEPGRMEKFRPGYYGDHSRFAREIVRQAVLLAAREELNVTVRDASIGDPAPQGRPSTVIEVTALCLREKTAIRLSRGQGEAREVLFERTLRDRPNLNDHRTLIRNAEIAVRDGLPEVLTKLGVKRKAGPKPGAGPLPAGLEEPLLKMAFLPQFTAIRQLHETIRTEGASPRRLHGLARGYANLGVLTDFQWDGAGQAYKARALLYAQRDVAARPGAPVARWNRAYAAALAGIHVLALSDLEDAGRFAKDMAEAARPTPPPWVELIDAHCRFAAEPLAKLRNGPVAELGALLYLMTVEHPSNTDVALRAARDAIAANPECFRAHHALYEVGGVANLHRATLVAPRVLTAVVPGRIAALPGVPDAVRKAIQDDQGEVALTRALDVAADPVRDPAEPSWGALARMIRETRFVCTYRRLDFMANHWNVPTGAYWEEARPLVVDHRFRPFLEALAGSAESRAELLAFADKLDTTDLGLNTSALEQLFLRKLPPNDKPQFYGISLFLSDWNAHDLSMALNYYRESRATDFAHKLLSVSPNSPYAMGMLVEQAWDEAEKKLDGWRKQVGDHPSLIGPLARRYAKLERLDEAETLLNRYIALSPDPWAYREKADREKARGNLARWKEILDEYLAKVEDHGLDHARVRVEIAESLMATGFYDTARPYAEAAAESWSEWALRTAQKCAEGQQDWEVAEKWAQGRAMRYPGNSGYDWLDFCVRTGEGHLQASSEFTLALLKRWGDKDHLDVVIPRVALWMAQGEPGKTFDPLQRLVEAEAKAKPEDPSGHQVALVTLLAAAGQAGDVPRFDSTAQQFLDRYKTDSPKFSGILTHLREAIAKKDPEALDQKSIDALIEETPPEGRSGPALVVASYLAGAKQHEKAKPYWKQTLAKEQSFFWWRVIANSKLRDRASDR